MDPSGGGRDAAGLMDPQGGGEAAAGSSAAASSSAGRPSWTEDEKEKVVAAALPWAKSVVRIIRTKGKGSKRGYVGTGNAFVVCAHREMSIFLTCEHNFIPGEEAVIRLYGGEKDYPVDRILHQDKTLDLLLFSVKGCPVLQCPPFSEDGLVLFDLVAIVGYSSPTLIIKQKEETLILVKEPTILPGEILAKPVPEEDSKVRYQLNVINDCPTSLGMSGAPLFNENGQVAGIHLDADKSWRQSASATTVQKRLRKWLRLAEEVDGTIEQLMEMVYETVMKADRRKR